jgi:hypothetical protein
VTVVEQHEQARALANQVRLAGAAWKRETHALPTCDGLVRLADLLVDDGDLGFVGRLRLSHAVSAVRKLSRARGERLVRDAGIFRFDKRIMELTWRQRYALSALLRVEAEKWRD